MLFSLRGLSFLSGGNAITRLASITDWVKVGQSYTSTNNEADPSLSGEKVSLPKSESDMHATRNSGRKRRAADFFCIDEDSGTKKRSLSPSDDTDSGSEAKARHHKSGED